MRKKVAKQIRKLSDASPALGNHFYQTSITNQLKKSPTNRSPLNMKIDAKRMPKWSQHQCQNASEINTKTGIEKDQKNHEQLCFSVK